MLALLGLGHNGFVYALALAVVFVLVMLAISAISEAAYSALRWRERRRLRAERVKSLLDQRERYEAGQES